MSKLSLYKHVQIVLTGVEQAQNIVVITDINSSIVYVNPKFYDVTKYIPEEVIGKNMNLLQSGRTSVETYKNLWETLNKGEVWRGEFLNKAKDGSLFWEISTITPIKDEYNKVTHFMKISEVVDNLRHTILNLWSIVSLATHFILILDNNLKIKFANNILALELGYKSELEMVGLDWLDFIPVHFKSVLSYVQNRLIVADQRYREFTYDIIKLNQEVVTVKWFNSIINSDYNWTLSIGVPLVQEEIKDSVIQYPYHSLREYWKEAIKQDKVLIDSIKAIVDAKIQENKKDGYKTT